MARRVASDPDWEPIPFANALVARLLRGMGVGIVVFILSSTTGWIVLGRPRFLRFFAVCLAAGVTREVASTFIDQAYARRVRHNASGGWVKPICWVVLGLAARGLASFVAFRRPPAMLIVPVVGLVVDWALIALVKPWKPGPTMAQVSSLLGKGEVTLGEHISVIQSRIDQAH